MPAVLGTLNNLSNFTGLGYLGSGVKSLGDKEYKQAASQFAEGTLRLGLTAAVSALSFEVIFGNGSLTLSSNLHPKTNCVSYTPSTWSYFGNTANCNVVNRANTFLHESSSYTYTSNASESKKDGKNIKKLFSSDFPIEVLNFITKSPSKAANLVNAWCGSTTNDSHCIDRNTECRQEIHAKCLSGVLDDSNLMSRLFSITIEKEKA